MPETLPPPPPSAATLLDCYIAAFDAEAQAELARLAAAMAGTQQAFDATVLLRRALALWEGAAGAIAGRRAALLREADAEALTKLDDALKSRGFSVEDPRRVPIRHEQERRHHEKRTPEREAEQRAWQDDLSMVATESGIPCPALPCLRNDAFRWAVSAPVTIAWAEIERAFLDYLSTHAQELRGLTAGEFLETYWSDGRECDAQALSELATGFRRYWRDNDCAGRIAAVMAAKEETSRRRATSGRKANQRQAAETREKKRWLAFCRDFKQSTGGKQPREESVEAFLAGQKGKSRQKKRQREFLQTIFQARRHASVLASLSEPLAKCGIKLTADAARECYDVIFGK